MQSSLKRNLVIMFVLIAASVAAIALRPTKLMSDTHAAIVLDDLVPKEFGDWKEIEGGGTQVVNPQVEAQLNEIYSQTLSRTYINNHNEIIMLSIAYGGNQSRNLQVHRPEVCYVAQGFQITSLHKNDIALSSSKVPVMQLTARHGKRVEPITYWVRMGDEIVRGNLEQGRARLKYGLSGFIPDGLLFRVSNISDTDEFESYQLHQAFIQDLFKSIAQDKRTALLGALDIR